jgi:hypothetical protein
MHKSYLGQEKIFLCKIIMKNKFYWSAIFVSSDCKHLAKGRQPHRLKNGVCFKTYVYPIQLSGHFQSNCLKRVRWKSTVPRQKTLNSTADTCRSVKEGADNRLCTTFSNWKTLELTDLETFPNLNSVIY